jgi:thioredoxin domain-containing protein 5
MGFAYRCGHCQKLAPHWTSLASHMKSKLNIAEVNCDDQPSVCKAEGIQGYPMLFYYANGVKTEYNGGRKLEAMRTFAEKASEPLVRKLVGEDLGTYVAKEKVVYVLVHAAGDSQIVVCIVFFSVLVSS